jgi:hypothetical protein
VPVYVGGTSGLSARAASDLAARWPTRDPWIAYRAFPARQSGSCVSLRATCWDGAFGSRGQRRHANTASSTTVLMLDEPFAGAAIMLEP